MSLLSRFCRSFPEIRMDACACILFGAVAPVLFVFRHIHGSIVTEKKKSVKTRGSFRPCT